MPHLNNNNNKITSSIFSKQDDHLTQPCWSEEKQTKAQHPIWSLHKPLDQPLLLLLSQFCHVRLCDPIDGSPPGSRVPGILQARTLEWIAISFSNVWKWKVKVKSLSRVQLVATPWTAAYQAPLSMGFSRQEYWSGVPLPSPGPASRRAETKRKKRIQPWSLGKGDLKHNKLKNNEKAEKHYTIEGTS